MKRLMLALVIVSASSASALATGNVAFTGQAGFLNSAFTLQGPGNFNTAITLQRGAFNRAATLQFGSFDFATTVQFGVGNTAVTIQGP